MTTRDQLFNYLFQTKVAGWTPLTARYHDYFSEEEVALIERSSRSFLAEKRTVVELFFENRFASLGGLAAVVKQLPQELRKQGERVLVLTPLHIKNRVVRKAMQTGALKECFCDLPVSVCEYSAKVSCYKEVDASLPTYHIGIKGRFRAGDNPYGYEEPEQLLLDSLSFCAVVPSVCARLGYTSHVLFHAHDWECAAIALFARYAVISSLVDQVRTVLTLHNSFDAALPERYQLQFFGKKCPVYTVLQCMLPLVHGPLTTVSTPFAHELRNDPLQSTVFTDHLQDLFRRNPPLGIENGMFVKPEKIFSDQALSNASKGDVRLLYQEKQKNRDGFFSVIKASRRKKAIGSFTDEARVPAIPVLFMSGRYDHAQKGFDVIFNAFSRLPKGAVNLFFTPTLHNDDDDLSYFSDIAEAFAGHVVIWPFKISSKEYMQCLRGASYLVMPSFYEPFGAASEGFLNGTPLLARATGGLLAQVQPEETFVMPDQYASILPSGGHDTANGILYKEQYDGADVSEQWRALLQLPFKERMTNPIYVSMVDAAHEALEKAIQYYHDPQRYALMIFEGLHAARQFTWDKAVEKYGTVFDVASYRGI